jgi:hypothetical protein
MTDKRRATDNTGLAKLAVQRSKDTFVVTESSVLRINFCGKNRHLRQARERTLYKIRAERVFWITENGLASIVVTTA